MLKLSLEELTVKCELLPEGGMDVIFKPLTDNCAECMNTAMELKGFEYVEDMIDWIIISTSETINEAYPTSTDGERKASAERVSVYVTNTIVNQINEILSEIKVQ